MNPRSLILEMTRRFRAAGIPDPEFDSAALLASLCGRNPADLLISDQQKEGLNLIRSMLGNTSSAVAIPQLLSMMEKTANNEMLLLKMKDWFALMNR